MTPATTDGGSTWLRLSKRGQSGSWRRVWWSCPEGVGLTVVPGLDQRVAGRLAERFFGHPAKRLKLIGVTGTNGKTTVAMLTRYLLEAAGVKCGLIGTIYIDEGSPAGHVPAELTTPGAVDLHRHFAAMVANGCAACAMEVSSHALDQGRVDGLRFDVAVFTNLTQDHLDYHGTMDAYAAAKAKLFTGLDRSATAVLNADDPASLRMVKESDARRVWTAVTVNGAPPEKRGRELFRVEDDKKDSRLLFEEALRIEPGPGEAKLELLTAEVLQATATRCEVMLRHGLGEARLGLPLVGRHNVSNWLQAVAAAVAAGADWSDSVEVFSAMPAVPGRLEPVHVPPPDALPGAPVPAVLVDYAHTPDALENVLNALRPLTSDGRLIVVFGCGGDRDRTKRPKMAAVACALADRAVLTSDNPRTEDPQRILDEALAGVPPEHRERVAVEIDRARAIDDTDYRCTAGRHRPHRRQGPRGLPDRRHREAPLRRPPNTPPRPWRSGNTSSTASARNSADRYARLLVLRQPATPHRRPLAHAAPPILTATVTGITQDTRTLQPGQAYLAVAGENFDGHAFVEAAFAAGASLAIVQSDPSAADPVVADVNPPARSAAPVTAQPTGLNPRLRTPVLLVDDTVAALQQLADAYRDVLADGGCTVVSVSGSNGKTTTRHLIHHVLTACGLAGTQSPKSFNNHLGVPLTLLAALPQDDFVACEVGTNHPGEIDALARLVRPDIAVLTSLGEEHLEFFHDLEGVAKEESAILPHLRPGGAAIIEVRASVFLQKHDLLGVPTGCQLIRHGWLATFDQPSDIAHDEYDAFDANGDPLNRVDQVFFKLRYFDRYELGQWSVCGSENLDNAAAAIGVGGLMGAPLQEMVQSLTRFSPPDLRSQTRWLSQDVTLLIDCYNANPASMRAALDTLCNCDGRRVAILGDMRELGEHAPRLHHHIASYATEAADETVLIGEAFGGEAWSDDLPDRVAARLRPGDTVLLKASRGMRLERLIPAIEARFPPAAPERDKSRR